MFKHTHKCCKCSHTWECTGVGKQRKREAKVCEIDKAVKINKDGPYCEMCQHIEMAARIADVRGLEILSIALRGHLPY